MTRKPAKHYDFALDIIQCHHCIPVAAGGDFGIIFCESHRMIYHLQHSPARRQGRTAGEAKHPAPPAGPAALAGMRSRRERAGLDGVPD